MGELLKRRPVLLTAGAALGAAVALAVTLWAGLFGTWSVWPWLVCWLVAVNPIAFGMS